MAWNKYVAKIPKGISKQDRISIGLEIIEYIERRAIEQNKGFDPDTGRERRFPKYTKEYAAKKGVSRSDVDLVATAKMFNAVEVLSDSSGSVTVGVSTSSPEAGKAEGNIKGTYGTSRAISPRPFLGLPQTKLAEIVSKYVSED